MILNNYNAMKFIKTMIDEPLSLELIRDIHEIVTAETLENEHVGKFRNSNDIAIVDIFTGETFHEPVDYRKILPMIEALCKFINEDEPFIHPIIKGIILHFVIAYIHPFQDGNRRVSRTLFYWYTMKKEYWQMEHLSISKSIKNHRGKYDRVYVLSETDDNDTSKGSMSSRTTYYKMLDDDPDYDYYVADYKFSATPSEGHSKSTMRIENQVNLDAQGNETGQTMYSYRPTTTVETRSLDVAVQDNSLPGKNYFNLKYDINECKASGYGTLTITPELVISSTVQPDGSSSCTVVDKYSTEFCNVVINGIWHNSFEIETVNQVVSFSR